MSFVRATRSKVFLTMAITGPSGAGKTMGALYVASGLANGKPIAVVDTENGSASYYADDFEFDVTDLVPPYTVDKAIAALNEAVAAGYGVLVLDSISPIWDGKGGLLAQKEAKDKTGGNQFANWRPFKEEWKRLIEALRTAPIDVIVTMRSKTEYAEQDEAGRKRVVKLGFAPVAPPDADYEFDVVLDVERDHTYRASKDRTGVFDIADPGKITKETGAILREWRESAKSEAKPAEARKEPATYKTLYIPVEELNKLNDDAQKAGLSKGDVRLVLDEVAQEEMKKPVGSRVLGKAACSIVRGRLGLLSDDLANA